LINGEWAQFGKDNIPTDGTGQQNKDRDFEIELCWQDHILHWQSLDFTHQVYSHAWEGVADKLRKGADEFKRQFSAWPG
jgi:hypothetical protein